MCHVNIPGGTGRGEILTLTSTALVRGLRPSSGKGRFHGVVTLWPSIDPRVSIADICLSYAFRWCAAKPIRTMSLFSVLGPACGGSVLGAAFGGGGPANKSPTGSVCGWGAVLRRSWIAR